MFEEHKGVSWACLDGNNSVTIDDDGCVNVATNAQNGSYIVTATSTFDVEKSVSAVIKVYDMVSSFKGSGTKTNPYIISNELDFSIL